MIYDICIIGGGVAGMTAALYAKRNNKSVLILEGESFGGQISNSPRVENFPTIQSISGMELADRLFNQILEYQVDFEIELVEHLEKADGLFNIKTNYGSYQAYSTIIASGVKHKKLMLPQEENLLGNGISYCAVCDGPFFKGQDVVLVGDGNTALQYALLLCEYCSTVKICTLFDRFFGDESHVKALLSKNNVEIIHEVAAIDTVGTDSLEGIVFKSTKTNQVFTIKAQGLFIAIGQIPDNKVFASLADLDKAGYIISDESCKTKTEGLFVAGDCRTKDIRQLTTAAADGAVAALGACNYLSKL